MSRRRDAGYRAKDPEEEGSVTPLTEQIRRAKASRASSSGVTSNVADGEPRRVIVLPDVSRAKTLAEEFAEHLPVDVIERALAAARHALERAHLPATQDAVDQLAREHLRARVAAFVNRRRT
jgi:hypothetical protein